ncbi:lipopolysaccharide transport periplasmic protein LptA [Gayadomonas joobiniege]|uniref:lipopolysaccharide transport periplasmic protein LptA n=1 Tax=Gayadomonas joobiniege TaxID=1234606 RepID=UPI00036B2DBD|nr:lipopolysaccharide transport periplasmic protein LptA [Gayadomonas joobiniege]
MLNKKLVLILCLLNILPGYAVQSDFNQNIVIDANEQKLDIKSNTLTFSGEVEVQQGSLSMQAVKLEVIKADNEEQGQDVLIATGTPAIYRQTLDNGEQLTAEALTIHYQVGARILTLTGQAKLSQPGSHISGEKIEYQLNEQKLVASSKQKSGEKVRTVLTPRKQEE